MLAKTPADRVHAFDALRVICVLCIVWFHSGGPAADLMTWRLPVLMMISVALVSTSTSVASLRTLAARRARRLLVPFAFWCGVYFAWQLVYRLPKGLPLDDLYSPRVLIAGTAHHLWYLPFAFMATLTVNAGTRALARALPDALRAPPVAFAAACAAGAACITVASMTPPPGLHLNPLGAWLASLPAIPLGIAVGLSVRCGTSRSKATRLAFASATALVTMAVLLACGVDRGTLAVRYALAVPILGAGVLFMPPLTKSIQSIAALAMGVYLCHVLVHQLVLRLNIAPVGSAIHSINVCLVSLAVAWAMSRTPLLKRFI